MGEFLVLILEFFGELLFQLLLDWVVSIGLSHRWIAKWRGPKLLTYGMAGLLTGSGSLLIRRSPVISNAELRLVALLVIPLLVGAAGRAWPTSRKKYFWCDVALVFLFLLVRYLFCASVLTS